MRTDIFTILGQTHGRALARRLELLDSPRRRARNARKKAGGGAAIHAAINVTPLVDVVLVLLIIFMVVTPLLGGKIDLPRVIDPLPWTQAHDDLQIFIFESGEVRVGDEPVAASQLAPQVEKRLHGQAAASVLLQADQALPFGRIREVLEALREAGSQSVGLATLPLDSQGQTNADDAPDPGDPP